MPKAPKGSRGNMIHRIYGPSNLVKGLPSTKKHLDTPSTSKAIGQTPAVAPNRKPSDRQFGGT